MSGSIVKAVELAADLCRPFEGLYLKPYICPAGYPTIGYGTVYKPDGTKVTMDHPAITKQTAEEWLIHELTYNYLPGVLKASPHLIAYPEILGALTDFAYNLGNARYNASTLRKRVNVSEWALSKQELMRWTRGGGRVLAGLVRRRKAECALLP